MAAPAAYCVVDLDQEWVSSFSERVKTFKLRKNSPDEPCTIFRVPAEVRKGDPNAYEPKMISFGPYHRNKPDLLYMEQLKLWYLQKLLLRNPNTRFDGYLKVIKGVEAQARASYSEDIEMESNAFVEMMLLDGGFIVELILMLIPGTDDDSSSSSNRAAEEDPVLTTVGTLALIMYDMLMLENQIPFFILERIFELASTSASASRDGISIKLNKCLLYYFGDFSPRERVVIPTEGSGVPKFYHVLHFFHFCIMPPEKCPQFSHPESSRFDMPLVRWISSILCCCVLSPFSVDRYAHAHGVSEDSTPTIELVPCATKLKAAGVKFKERKGKSLLDVAFHDGTMEIPPLKIDDKTNSLFRNLIAFEQCFPRVGTNVTTYASFMDCLVDTGDDTALLHRYGCIVSNLGNHDEAALLFNGLCKDVIFGDVASYLSGLFKDVQKHYGSRWNNWRAKLLQDYFSNPWSVLSLVAAIILLLLTFIQSLFAVFAYFRPPHSN